ncbi:MAG: hypothetical protein IJX26_01875 [Clostridia bacterium]|nr:hypothetical protein [Clostridia bacterium]
MQVFFVIDNVSNLSKKLNMIQQYFGDNIKFFVNTKLYPKIFRNEFIIKNLAGIYEKNEKSKIDEYIKSENYNLCSVLLYYSSVEINENMLEDMRKNIQFDYSSISFKKKENFLTKWLKAVYKKIVKLMFGVQDNCCYTKFQYINQEFMFQLVESVFNNHILIYGKHLDIDVETKEITNSLKTKIKFRNYHLYNLVALFSFVIMLVVFIQFFELMFWVYFFLFMLIIMSIVLAFMLAVHNIFHDRYRK